jgi:transcriptional regulator with XRE-family HTH domain
MEAIALQNYRKIVKLALQERGMTVYELAKLSCVCRSTLGRWLSGRTRIGDNKLAAVCDVLGLELKDRHEQR